MKFELFCFRLLFAYLKLVNDIFQYRSRSRLWSLNLYALKNNYSDEDNGRNYLYFTTHQQYVKYKYKKCFNKMKERQERKKIF